MVLLSAEALIGPLNNVPHNEDPFFLLTLLNILDRLKVNDCDCVVYRIFLIFFQTLRANDERVARC
jgi:hypothetical protein